MPCRFGHILLVLAAALLTGCGRPKVIPEDELVSLYVDMFIADQWLRDHPDEKKVADTTLFFDPLFREHGYTFEDYADSLWTDGLSIWPRKSRDTLARENFVELKEMPLSMKTRHKAK